MPRKRKAITVRLILDWTFDEKEWSEEKKHREQLKNEPKIVLGEDIINTFHSLNSLAYPEVKDIVIVPNDK